jgi:hypothetical protein
MRTDDRYEFVERPPVEKTFEKMTRAEAELFFQWHMDCRYKRINNMCQVIHFEPDYSEESLISLWKKVIQLYKCVKRGKVSQELFESVINCCSLYLGEVFIRNNKELYWNCHVGNDFFRNRPVIAGFLGEENPIELEPMFMIWPKERNLVNGEENKKDLYDLYKSWEQYCPQKRGSTSNSARNIVRQAINKAIEANKGK